MIRIVVHRLGARASRPHPYLKQNLFHSRMIRPVVGGGGAACLKHPCFTLE